MAKAATKKAMKASKAKKATKAMKATPDERTKAQTIRRRTIHSGSDREEDEDILTFTQNELATLIAEHLFCGQFILCEREYILVLLAIGT